MKPTVLYYAKCSTCQKALKWLDEKGIDYEKRPMKEENPTADELKNWYEKSGLPLKKRPLLVTNQGVFPGFKESVWEEIIEK